MCAAAPAAAAHASADGELPLHAALRAMEWSAAASGGVGDAVEPGFCAAGHALVKGAAAYDEGWCDSFNYERMDVPGEEKNKCFAHIDSMRDAWSCLTCGVDFCEACNFKLAEHGGRSSSDAAAARRALFESNYAVVNALLAANPGAAALRGGARGGDAAAATLPLETVSVFFCGYISCESFSQFDSLPLTYFLRLL